MAARRDRGKGIPDEDVTALSESTWAVVAQTDRCKSYKVSFDFLILRGSQEEKVVVVIVIVPGQIHTRRLPEEPPHNL